MAIAVTKDFPCSKRIGRNLRSLSGSIAFDSSYPTGGEPATDITRCFKSCSQVICEQKSGYLFEFDKADKKIKVLMPLKAMAVTHTTAALGALTDHNNNPTYHSPHNIVQAAGEEVVDAVDLSGLTGVKFMAMGR